MKFPAKKYEDAGEFCDDYFALMASASGSVDRVALTRAADLLTALFSSDLTLYVCGNGGSAAISNHLLCDFSKGIQTDTTLRPKVVSLSCSIELITAIGNDIDFADVFLYQLRTAARSGDALMTVSSSGNSENIVRAIEWARHNGMQTIAMTGFNRGRSGSLADINMHVSASNYGVVEDIHQSMMHILAQLIRMRMIDSALIGERSF